MKFAQFIPLLLFGFIVITLDIILFVLILLIQFAAMK